MLGPGLVRVFVFYCFLFFFFSWATPGGRGLCYSSQGVVFALALAGSGRLGGKKKGTGRTAKLSGRSIFFTTREGHIKREKGERTAIGPVSVNSSFLFYGLFSFHVGFWYCCIVSSVVSAFAFFFYILVLGVLVPLVLLCLFTQLYLHPSPFPFPLDHCSSTSPLPSVCFICFYICICYHCLLVLPSLTRASFCLF